MKVRQIRAPDTSGLLDYAFFCPGCGRHHVVHVRTGESGLGWSYNGDPDRPTFSPSVSVQHTLDGAFYVCHSEVQDGRIRFFEDSTHLLAGETVELPDMETP